MSSLQRRVLGLRCSLRFRSFEQPSRWLARFTRECERDALVTTFYPCRHVAEHPMLYAPQAGKTNRLRTGRPIYQDGRAQRAAIKMERRLFLCSTTCVLGVLHIVAAQSAKIVWKVGRWPARRGGPLQLHPHVKQGQTRTDQALVAWTAALPVD